MNNYQELLLQIADALNSAKSVALCGHIMPDGDCLGSMLALGRALQKQGKEVVLLSPDPVPVLYSFLPGADQIQLATGPGEKYDLFVIVDTSVSERLGSCQDLLQRVKRVVVIDHHINAGVFGHIYLNDSGAAAVGEIVFDLLKVMHVTIGEDLAACLYVAIATDTGSFQYENTNFQTHLRVAELLQTGLNTSRINKLLYEEKPLVSIKLIKDVLETLAISECGSVAWITVTKVMQDKLQIADELLEGMINYPRMIKGVEVAISYREIGPDKYKISFRSKYFFDVSKLAAVFGGGGHARAAGCTVEGSLEQIKKDILKTILLTLRTDN